MGTLPFPVYTPPPVDVGLVVLPAPPYPHPHVHTIPVHSEPPSRAWNGECRRHSRRAPVGEVRDTWGPHFPPLAGGALPEGFVGPGRRK